MPGIMSGLEPVRLKDGGFPDLTGDGKVTRADILKGRGVPGLANGGDPRFMSREGFFSYKDDPERLNFRDVADFIFDPTDPLDYAAAGIAATGVGLPAAAAMKTANTGKKVVRGIGTTLGATPLVREGIDFLSNPIEYGKGIIELVAPVPDAGGTVGEIAEALRTDPKGTAEIIFETVSKTSGYPVERAEGGIMQYANGTGDMGVLPASAKTPTGKKKKAVMTVMDMMDEIAEKLPTKTKKKTKKEKEPSAEDRKIIEDAAKQREAEVIAQQARLERARINRANEPTTPQPARPQTPVRTDAPDVGPPRPVTSQGANVNKAADDAFDASKKTDMEGSVAPPLKRPFYKKKRYIIPAGAAAAASLLPLLSKDEKPEPNLRNINPEILPDNVDLTDRKDTLTIQGSSNMVGRTGNKIDENPETNQSLMYYMKQNLNEKGFDLDADTQTFTGDKKPTFFDYVKSLPGGYVDKVADDENYAKKMMAGFLNMMKPVEGYVPINPAVAFGEGYFGEETRQADMLPADAKLLEYLKRNKGALAKLQSLEATRAGTTIGEGAGSDDVLAGYVLLKEGLREEYGIGEDEIANYDIYYIDPKTKQETFVSSRMFGSLFDNPIKEIANPNFILKLRGT